MERNCQDNNSERASQDIHVIIVDTIMEQGKRLYNQILDEYKKTGISSIDPQPQRLSLWRFRYLPKMTTPLFRTRYDVCTEIFIKEILFIFIQSLITKQISGDTIIRAGVQTLTFIKKIPEDAYCVYHHAAKLSCTSLISHKYISICDVTGSINQEECLCRNGRIKCAYYIDDECRLNPSKISEILECLCTIGVLVDTIDDEHAKYYKMRY